MLRCLLEHTMSDVVERQPLSQFTWDTTLEKEESAFLIGLPRGMRIWIVAGVLAGGMRLLPVAMGREQVLPQLVPEPICSGTVKFDPYRGVSPQCSCGIWVFFFTINMHTAA